MKNPATQSNANNYHALNADEFISLLKRTAVDDEAGACGMIDRAAPHLSAIIYDQRAFGLLYRTLSQTVLSHLFSKADFIPYRFFSCFAAARTWLLDNGYSIEHRLFLFKFYQSHFIQLLQSQPMTLGILNTLLSFFEALNEKDVALIKDVILAIKPKMISLFQEQNILPALRYFLLSTMTSAEFTLLIREIPECFDLLCNIENPKFFPLIQFEKLPLEQHAHIQIQFIKNLINYHDQRKGYPAFFAIQYHTEDNDFISTLKTIINESEKSHVEKITNIEIIINERQSLLSMYIKKLLGDRQFNENTAIPCYK